MDKPVADAILAAADAIGIEMTIREDYSGRGMYGKATTGIVYDGLGNLLQCVATAVCDLKEEADYRDSLPFDEDDEEGGEEDFLSPEDFCEALAHFRFDNMGRSDIVY